MNALTIKEAKTNLKYNKFTLKTHKNVYTIKYFNRKTFLWHYVLFTSKTGFLETINDVGRGITVINTLMINMIFLSLVDSFRNTPRLLHICRNSIFISIADYMIYCVKNLGRSKNTERLYLPKSNACRVQQIN